MPSKHCLNPLPLLLVGVLWGCAPGNPGPGGIQVLKFTDPVRAVAAEPPIVIHSARNETVHFAICLTQLPESGAALRVGPLALLGRDGKGDPRNRQPAIGPVNFSAFQVLPMPIDLNRAGFVRHTGLDVGAGHLPRALLPLPMQNGEVKLDGLRDPDAPANPKARPRKGGPPPIVWMDIQVPPTIPPGEYQGTCELTDDGSAIGVVPIRLTVDDFVIPDQRHLLMVGQVDWRALARLYAQQFREVRAELLSRREKRYAPAVRVLDDLVKLGQSHRLQVVIPQLQPIVKWPSGSPPQIDWTDFDPLVSPWLTGEAFADILPLGYWPMPRMEHLDEYPRASQLQYWRAVAAHFQQMDWQDRSSVEIERSSSARVGLAESVEISRRAAEILAANPRVRVTVPLEEEQVQLATPQNPGWIQSEQLGRLLYAGAPLVSVPPLQRLPEGVGTRWLRSDLPGLIPYLGAGADEREVRLWAWLAFLRNATLIQWRGILPTRNDPATPADVDELIWFYPGSWFGVDGTVPSIQLKWMRRAEQDFEYLWLARQRGQGTFALNLARLITKPVELQPLQGADQAYALLSGSSEGKAWEEVLNLVSRAIRLNQPGAAVDEASQKKLTYEMSTWAQDQQKPLLMARATEWSMGQRDADGNRWLNLRLAIDVYNAADRQPDRNALKWEPAPEGWSTSTRPKDVAKLGAYSVNRIPMDARINLGRVTPATRQPVKVTFIDGYTGRPSSLEVVAPVAWCERRTGPPPRDDGSLGDWSPADALHEGRLVRMLSRPGVQKQQLELAAANSAIYSTWTDAALYLGFRMEGADAPLYNAQTSFVRYDFRRAWGEDICEVLIQPVYNGGLAGPLLHVACKPRGQLEVQRRLDEKMNAQPWQAFAGAGIHYAATVETATWRGEIAIPWDAINPPGQPNLRPLLLRFNFVQHRGSTGQSWSWAGPIDYGRDESFTGILQIRQ